VKSRPRPAPGRPLEIACICGCILVIARDIGERHAACPGCSRRFQVAFGPDPATGEEFVMPLYLDDGAPAGGTFVADPSPGATDAEGTGVSVDREASPEPPEQLWFDCACGARLRAVRDLYDRKARCPACDLQFLLRLSYDAASGEFAVIPARLGGRSPGDTWVADPA